MTYKIQENNLTCTHYRHACSGKHCDVRQMAISGREPLVEDKMYTDELILNCLQFVTQSCYR